MASVVDVSQVEALAQDYTTASGRVGRVGRKALQAEAESVHEIQVAHVRATANPTGDLESHLIINMRGDGRATLALEGGLTAPVSRRYARALREAGWY